MSLEALSLVVGAHLGHPFSFSNGSINPEADYLECILELLATSDDYVLGLLEN